MHLGGSDRFQEFSLLRNPQKQRYQRDLKGERRAHPEVLRKPGSGVLYFKYRQTPLLHNAYRANWDHPIWPYRGIDCSAWAFDVSWTVLQTLENYWDLLPGSNLHLLCRKWWSRGLRLTYLQRIKAKLSLLCQADASISEQSRSLWRCKMDWSTFRALQWL